ncbi:MAG: uncharacterized protein JWP46_701 [Modestobacter sp.]|jgi:hypothetical protein|nr:uncharacterized protein [Modestobacter sp.]
MSGRTVGEIADRYRTFAQVEAAGVSPRYAELAEGIAADPDVLAFLAELPAPKQQPNLLLAALQYRHGTPAGPGELHDRVLGDADRLRATMIARATQTNEPARCTALLPLLAGLPQPLTLIEVGASAGLCLYPDRYAYDYDGVRIGGPSPVTLTCTTAGPVPLPDRLPDVAARIGVDLDPRDPADPDDRAWLRALVWPGRPDRLARLDAALDLAAAEPARMLTGHLLDQLPAAVAAAPAGGTTVVFHTAVLPYLDPAERAAFTALVGELPVRWISQEGASVLPAVRNRLPDGERGPDARAELVLALDGEPVARTAPHGGQLRWLPTG